jgi:DNA excision repair protein ERCC-4
MILVDDRERSSGVGDALDALHVAFKITRLPIADYVISNSIYIERKTCADFIASLADRRLFSQAAALRKGNKRAVMIIEGTRLPGTPSVRGALCSLAVQWCLPVLRSTDAVGTAWLLAHIAAYQELPLQPMRYYDFRAKRGISSLGRRMLMQVQQLGPQTADALLQRFGSFGAVVGTAENELLKVPGVSRHIAGQLALLRMNSAGEKEA